MSSDVLSDVSTRLARIVSNNNPRAYYKSKLPNSVDDEVRQICATIMSLTPEQRDSLISSLANEAKGILWGFGLRTTMLSVRQNSLDELLKGLVGFILAAVGEDYRDILVDVSLFYNSATKLTTEPNKLFTTACSYYPTQKTTCEIIMGYLDYPEEHSIEDMGYREVEGPSGLAYIGRTSSTIPEGWR